MSNANVTVSAWSRKSWPAIPDMKTIGKKTAIVVSVAATTADATSEVPFLAASTIPSPCSRFRTMFSSTTMELSTSMPTARAMPPSDMMFSDTSLVYINRNVPMTEIGIAMLTIVVDRASRRKPYNTMMAKMPPMNAAFLTLSTAEEMKRDWS